MNQTNPYDTIQQLRRRVAELEKERDEWEANSGQWEQEYYKVCKERDKALQYWQIAEGRCDALIKQRDELVAALEKSRNVFDSYVKLHRDKVPPDEEKAARNAFHRGVCGVAIASVKEKQNDSA